MTLPLPPDIGFDASQRGRRGRPCGFSASKLREPSPRRTTSAMIAGSHRSHSDELAMTLSGLPGTRGRKRIYLMRHGEVSYRRPDGRTVFSTAVPLTQEGADQALAMRELLAEVPFDLGAHTGLERTRQTAELVLEGR